MAGAIQKDRYSDVNRTPGGPTRSAGGASTIQATTPEDYSKSSAGAFVNAGQAAQGRAPIQLDTSAGDMPVGQATLGGLDQQRQSAQMLQGANGGPSAAGAQGQAANSSALSAMLQSRAQGGSLAHSLAGGAAAGSANAAQVGATRANEVASRSNAYQSAIGGVRGSDQSIASLYGRQGQVQAGLANQQGQLDVGQQQLNDQYQQSAEQNAFNVNQANMNASLMDRQRAAGAEAFNVGDRNTTENNRVMYIQGGSNGAGSAAASYSASDERTKNMDKVAKGANLWSEQVFRGAENASPTQSLPAMAMNYVTDVTAARQREQDENQAAKPRRHAEIMQYGAKTLNRASDAAGGIDPRARGESPEREGPAPNGKGNEPMSVDREAVQAALAAEDRDNLSKHRGVTPRDVNARGKKPELLGPSARKNEYPSIADVMLPDTGVLADANRKMAGKPYEYKDEFVPPDEVPGQKHYGYMAQDLEKNPITATAVVKDQNGIRQVHQPRMLQAVASGVSDLQRQIDEMRSGGKK